MVAMEKVAIAKGKLELTSKKTPKQQAKGDDAEAKGDAGTIIIDEEGDVAEVGASSDAQQQTKRQRKGSGSSASGAQLLASAFTQGIAALAGSTGAAHQSAAAAAISGLAPLGATPNHFLIQVLADAGQKAKLCTALKASSVDMLPLRALLYFPKDKLPDMGFDGYQLSIWDGLVAEYKAKL